MIVDSIKPADILSPFIKSILVFECSESNTDTHLPFFADGFPGLMYHKSPNGLYVHPHNKRMPEFFIYGQTIEPIEIEVFGEFQMIVFQLYPFTLKNLFGIDPKSINDNCHDLAHNPTQNTKFFENLPENNDYKHKINIISHYFQELIERGKENFDHAIMEAIDKILTAKGKLLIAETAREVHLSKRTFERRFLSETGLTPKQFAKIIQFNCSLTQLSVKGYNELTDIVYQNGFADQSHFIRVFKSFTGQTPKQFADSQAED